jgi:predicted O-methyltransferase YrrM
MLPTLKGKIDSVIRRTARRILDADAKDIVRCRQRLALEETAKFIELNMVNVPHFPDKFSLLDEAIRAVSKEGLFCEFGVYDGQSINFIASRISTVIYGFDSFEGLPEDWLPEFSKGRFKVSKLPEVRENVSLIKGWFEEALPEFADRHAEQCSFIHIDCDLYSSTKTIFHHLKNRISKGTVIVFDEFFNFPGWKNWEYKAFAEFIADGDAEFEFLGYCRYGEQVAVKITRVRSS